MTKQEQQIHITEIPYFPDAKLVVYHRDESGIEIRLELGGETIRILPQEQCVHVAFGTEWTVGKQEREFVLRFVSTGCCSCGDGLASVVSND